MRQTTPDTFVPEPDDMPLRSTARVFARPETAATGAPHQNAGQHDPRSLHRSLSRPLRLSPSGIDLRGNPGLVRSLARLSTASRQQTPPDSLPGGRLLALFLVLTLAGWTLASFSLGSNDWHARPLPMVGQQATAQTVTGS